MISPESIWSNGIVNFNVYRELATLSLVRPTSWQRATQEEILSLEEANAKVASLFFGVVGAPDHACWSIRNCGNVTLTYISGKANRESPNCNDLTRKVALMRYTLQQSSSESLKFDEKIILEICEKAPGVFAKPFDHVPVGLREDKKRNIQQALDLLQYGVVKDELKEVCSDEDRPIDSICRVFCNESIVARQLITSTKLHHVLVNSTPYVDLHAMIIPKACRRSSGDRSLEESIEKNIIIQRLTSIFKHRFKVPMVGVMTRQGSLAGQTQPHLHDHVLGFDPNQSQFWMTNWKDELSGREVDKRPFLEAISRMQKILPPLFNPIQVVVFDIGKAICEQNVKHYIRDLKERKFVIVLVCDAPMPHHEDCFLKSPQVYEEVKKQTGRGSCEHLFVSKDEEFVDAGHAFGFHAIVSKDISVMIEDIEELLNSNL